MGKRLTIQMSVARTSKRPRISLCQVGCFMRMTWEPSERRTAWASTRVQARQAPRKVRTMKAMYVPSETRPAEEWKF